MGMAMTIRRRKEAAYWTVVAFSMKNRDSCGAKIS